MFTWGFGLGTSFGVVFLVFFEGGWNKVKGFSLYRLDAWMILKLTCDLIWEAGGNGGYDGGTFTIVWINTPHQKSSIMRTWQTWCEISILLSWQKNAPLCAASFRGCIYQTILMRQVMHNWTPVTGLLSSFCCHVWPSLDVCFWEAVLRHMFAVQGGGNGWFTMSYSKCSGMLVDVPLLWCWTVQWMEPNALLYLVVYPKIMFMAFL